MSHSTAKGDGGRWQDGQRLLIHTCLDQLMRVEDRGGPGLQDEQPCVAGNLKIGGWEKIPADTLLMITIFASCGDFTTVLLEEAIDATFQNK